MNGTSAENGEVSIAALKKNQTITNSTNNGTFASVNGHSDGLGDDEKIESSAQALQILRDYHRKDGISVEEVSFLSDTFCWTTHSNHPHS
jgi:hypothetical protein